MIEGGVIKITGNDTTGSKAALVYGQARALDAVLIFSRAVRASSLALSLRRRALPRAAAAPCAWR
jgi:hypothetical protein